MSTHVAADNIPLGQLHLGSAVAADVGHERAGCAFAGRCAGREARRLGREMVGLGGHGAGVWFAVVYLVPRRDG
jgi:hypothetical protein